MSVKTLFILALMCKLSSFAFAEECEKQRFFECDPNNRTVWLMNGNKDMKIACTGENVCNREHIKDATTEQYLPCMPATDVCGEALPFNCLPENKFELFGTNYDCPPKYFCNKDKLDSCDPCTRETCPDNAWTCGPKPEQVTTPSFSGECKAGSICKKEKIGPCNEVCELIDGSEKSGRSLLRITQFF